MAAMAWKLLDWHFYVQLHPHRSVLAIQSGKEALSEYYGNEAEFDFMLPEFNLSDIEGFRFLDTFENESKSLILVLSADYNETVVAVSQDKIVSKFYEEPIKNELITELWKTTCIEKMKRDEDAKILRGKSPFEGDREPFKEEWTNTSHS